MATSETVKGGRRPTRAYRPLPRPRRPRTSRRPPVPRQPTATAVPTQARFDCTCDWRDSQATLCPACVAWDEGVVLCVDGSTVAAPLWVTTHLVREKGKEGA